MGARPGWLFLAFVAQAVTYVCTAMVWRQALRRAGHPRSLGMLVPLGVAKLFTDQVVPSGGVSGAILVARGLTRRGVPTKVAMAALLVGLVAYFAAYLASGLPASGSSGYTVAQMPRSSSWWSSSWPSSSRFPRACSG